VTRRRSHAAFVPDGGHRAACDQIDLPSRPHLLRSLPGLRAALAAAGLALLTASASAQGLKLQNLARNTELCNRVADVSPDERIAGCTAVIESGAQTPRTLAIAFNNRGNAHYRKAELDRAMADYDSSIKANPRYARAFNNRGLAWQRKGDAARALADFNQSIRLDPKSAPAFVNRAEALRRKGEYRRAAEDYGAALRLMPTLEGVHNARCFVRAIMGELRPALADCNEALRLEGDAAATYDSRGLAYLKLRQWKEAIADYDAALERDPRLASSRYGRGLAKVRSGDAAGGEADMAEARATQPGIEGAFARYRVR
jgi:tetratricopeptide (TPR) repeat protein